MTDFDMAHFLEWRRHNPPMMGGSPELDEEGTADTTAEAAQGADETTDSQETPPPWGDDFNPERAWRTITHLREFETPAKTFKRLESGEDIDTFRTLAERYGFEIPDDDDEDDEELTETGDDPIAPLRSELDEIKQWKQEREARENLAAFNQHVDRLAGDDVDLTDLEREWILRKSVENGFNEKATEEAFNAITGFLSERDKRVIENYTKGKRKQPAKVPDGTQNVSDAPSNDTHEERVRLMLERLQGGPAA